MQDARYFRDQALLCLEISRQISDRHLAEKLQMEAAQYIDRATAVEKETDQAISRPASKGARKH